MKVLRILRGVFGAAVVWAAGWVALSLLSLGVLGLFGVALPPGSFIGVLLLNRVASGAVNGIAFASIIAFAARQKTFTQIRLPWIASCGALGAMLLPLAGQLVFGGGIPWSYLPYALGMDALFGATLATASLSVARRAPDQPQLDAKVRTALDVGSA